MTEFFVGRDRRGRRGGRNSLRAEALSYRGGGFGSQGKLEFAGFFLEFGEDAVDVGPVEADAGGFAGELQGFEESGEGAGDAVEDGDGLLRG